MTAGGDDERRDGRSVAGADGSPAAPACGPGSSGSPITRRSNRLRRSRVRTVPLDDLADQPSATAGLKRRHSTRPNAISSRPPRLAQRRTSRRARADVRGRVLAEGDRRHRRLPGCDGEDRAFYAKGRLRDALAKRSCRDEARRRRTTPILSERHARGAGAGARRGRTGDLRGVQRRTRRPSGSGRKPACARGSDAPAAAGAARAHVRPAGATLATRLRTAWWSAPARYATAVVLVASVRRAPSPPGICTKRTLPATAGPKRDSVVYVTRSSAPHADALALAVPAAKNAPRTIGAASSVPNRIDCANGDAVADRARCRSVTYSRHDLTSALGGVVTSLADEVPSRPRRARGALTIEVDAARWTMRSIGWPSSAPCSAVRSMPQISTGRSSSGCALAQSAARGTALRQLMDKRAASTRS